MKRWVSAVGKEVMAGSFPVLIRDWLRDAAVVTIRIRLLIDGRLPTE